MADLLSGRRREGAGVGKGGLGMGGLDGSYDAMNGLKGGIRRTSGSGGLSPGAAYRDDIPFDERHEHPLAATPSPPPTRQARYSHPPRYTPPDDSFPAAQNAARRKAGLDGDPFLDVCTCPQECKCRSGGGGKHGVRIRMEDGNTMAATMRMGDFSGATRCDGGGEEAEKVRERQRQRWRERQERKKGKEEKEFRERVMKELRSLKQEKVMEQRVRGKGRGILRGRGGGHGGNGRLGRGKGFWGEREGMWRDGVESEFDEDDDNNLYGYARNQMDPGIGKPEEEDFIPYGRLRGGTRSRRGVPDIGFNRRDRDDYRPMDDRMAPEEEDVIQNRRSKYASRGYTQPFGRGRTAARLSRYDELGTRHKISGANRGMRQPSMERRFGREEEDLDEGESDSLLS